MLGIKKWIDELFDSYLIEESMWVLIGKRNGLIWDCKAKEKKKERRILWCLVMQVETHWVG